MPTADNPINAAINDTQSTHSLAAEASAAYTVLLLRGIYPEVGLGVFTPVLEDIGNGESTPLATNKKFKALEGLGCEITTSKALTSEQLMGMTNVEVFLNDLLKILTIEPLTTEGKKARLAQKYERFFTSDTTCAAHKDIEKIGDIY